MRHRKAGRHLSRTTEHRQAMMRNLVTSLLQHERLETTQTKAKLLRQWSDKMISLAKRGDLHARRQSLAVVRSKQVVAKLFGELRERYLERPGGYTRIIPKGIRRGDAAPIAIVELVGRPEALPKSKKFKTAASE
ncbi:MAG: 50S ribosomal protein L17 [Desulfobacca sp. 4484_104]|nr:MAG: 50S ribosomal protein L17 [Desulfobacca sp. 4484_104]RLA88226.1 MAG: 50S ribosomal protein L17 [Deltaproteobacteria bacterium]